MVGIVPDTFRNNLGELETLRGFKSHVLDFNQHLVFQVLDDYLDSSIRSKMLILG